MKININASIYPLISYGGKNRPFCTFKGEIDIKMTPQKLFCILDGRFQLYGQLFLIDRFSFNKEKLTLNISKSIRIITQTQTEEFLKNFPGWTYHQKIAQNVWLLKGKAQKKNSPEQLSDTTHKSTVKLIQKAVQELKTTKRKKIYVSSVLELQGLKSQQLY